jgi:uncharacterized protein (TIGR02266 family)
MNPAGRAARIRYTVEMTASSGLVVKTVVVADDTAFVRDRFKAAIEGAGHRAVAARTGSELLSILRTNDPPIDLIVLDLRLPDGRGIELLRTIRKNDEHRPVVVFSGTIANTREVTELAGLGVNGYINEYTGSQHIVRALTPHLFNEEHSRRSSPRVALVVPVTYRVGNTIVTGLSLNVSTGGIAVRTTSPLDVDAVVKLRFRMPKGAHDVEATARVAWADRRVGMGLQFTTIDRADQAALETYVSAHFFSNRKA